MTNESPAPIYAWILLFILINAFWMTYDFILCPRYHWEQMTTEMQEGLNTTFGCFILGGMAFIVVTFVTHMLHVRVQS
jgi:hypothetical protein